MDNWIQRDDSLWTLLLLKYLTIEFEKDNVSTLFYIFRGLFRLLN